MSTIILINTHTIHKNNNIYNNENLLNYYNITIHHPHNNCPLVFPPLIILLHPPAWQMRVHFFYILYDIEFAQQPRTAKHDRTITTNSHFITLRQDARRRDDMDDVADEGHYRKSISNNSEPQLNHQGHRSTAAVVAKACVLLLSHFVLLHPHNKNKIHNI